MVQQLVQGMAGGETAGHSVPGTLTKNGNRISMKDLAALNTLCGFDKPPLARFVDIVWKSTRFDLGESFSHHQAVFGLVKEGMSVPMSPGLWTLLLTYSVCTPLGITKTVKDSSRFDAITGTIILIGYTVSPFVLGPMLLVLSGGGNFFT